MEYKYTPLWVGTGVVYEPRVSVLCSNPKNGIEIPILGLVDSGAADTLLHWDIGSALEIDITSGEPRTYRGLGAEIVAYMHTIQFRLADEKHARSIRCSFADVGSMGALLGQFGFFDNYKVVFEGYAKKFFVDGKR